MGADFPGDDCVIPTLRINFPPLLVQNLLPLPSNYHKEEVDAAKGAPKWLTRFNGQMPHYRPSTTT